MDLSPSRPGPALLMVPTRALTHLFTLFFLLLTLYGKTIEMTFIDIVYTLRVAYRNHIYR